MIAASIVVVAGGGAVAGALSSSAHLSHIAVAAAGKVTSVDGVTTTGHCGTAGKTGTFVVENLKTTKSITAHVTGTTKFVEPRTTGASFADVCVGKSVSVEGTATSGTFSATLVTVVPPPVRHLAAAGKVTSVDGVTTTGHCGTAGKTGTFVVENLKTTKSITAHVSGTTRFVEPRTTGTSFADVCVGKSVFVEGTATSGTFSATLVTIEVRHVAAEGKVTSVDGVTTTGHCGTAGKTGTFGVKNPKTTRSITAHVTGTTKFVEPRTTGASFADVCVGKSVSVEGTATSGTFSATLVTIEVRHVAAEGKVTSVDGVTTTGHCGTAGKTGTFGVKNPKTTRSITAHVTGTTKFVEPRTTGASFADVCVGKSVSVEGTATSGTFSATLVYVATSEMFLPQSET